MAHFDEVGLLRGTVRIVAYTPAWRTAFEREKARLQCDPLLLNTPIEHIGGTSIIGMTSKPIIDIAVGALSNSDLFNIGVALNNAGYHDHGQFGRHGGMHLFQFLNDCGLTTHHAHVMMTSSPNWGRSINFRNILQTDTQLLLAFIEIKAELAKLHPSDRQKYLKGKEAFVDRVYAILDERKVQESW